MSGEPNETKMIFLSALDLPPSSRAAFLDHACGSDEELKRKVVALLAASEESDNLLDQDRIEPAITQDSAPSQTHDFIAPEQSGTKIGRYKLQQPIGEGGMGSVFMAQQTDPVDRRVALKIIKPGMDSQQIIARFEAERQALAMMDHPNIAKVLDGGTTASGRPYFVMELVNGVPITEYCDQKHLTTQERLELFVPVCQAVQHAHQKGIIHRDLKPSNILVASYDDHAVPKVIDFGVAKATSQSLTDKTLFTQFGQIVGTLEYMSPEQAQRNQLDVDTRSDIYSLGVVLYELLTGATPFERKRLREAAFDEILRIIREEDPPTPSLRLSSIETLPNVAANRGVEPQKLVASLRGELDWIVMKSLDKDRTRRYETANGFAADIQRFLTDEPVLACPPSTAYRLRKFARKNRMLLASATCIAAALLIATGLSTWWAIRATTAEKKQHELAVEKTKLANDNAGLFESEKSARVLAEQSTQSAIAERNRAEENASIALRNQYVSHMQQVRLEWAANNVGRVRELLGRYSETSGPTDLRGWEWHYWTRMCHLELRTLEGHVGAVNSIAFSPDGVMIASAGSDGDVILWEAASGKLVARLSHNKQPVTSIAFAPTGTMLASGGLDKRAILWDIETREPLHKLVHDSAITCLAFSPNGEMLSTGTAAIRGSNCKRQVWNVASGTLLHTFKKPNGIRCLSFSNDGTKIICGSLRHVEVWNLSDGKLREIEAHTKLKDNNYQYLSTNDLAVSPDGQSILTCAEDMQVKLWSFHDGGETLSLDGHAEAVKSVSFHPSGRRVASAGVDQTIRIWNVADGTQRLLLRGHTESVSDIAFSPDGLRLASSSNDGTVKIWEANQPMDMPFMLTRGGEHMLSAQFGAQGYELAYTKFSGSGEGDRISWAILQNAGKQDSIREFRRGHEGWVRAATLSRDGRMLATCGGATIQVWNTETARVIFRSEGHASLSNDGLRFSPDGSLLLVDSPEVEEETGKRIPSHKLYDIGSGEMLYSRAIYSGNAVFSPDGKHLILASNDGGIDFVNAKTGITDFRRSVDQKCRSLRSSPDGACLSARVGSDLVLWDLETGAEEIRIPNSGKCVGMTANGSRVFTVSTSDALNVWHGATGDLMCKIASPRRSGFVRVALSSDSKILAVKGLPFIHLLDIRGSTRDIDVEREATALAATFLKFPMGYPPLVTEKESEILARLDQSRCISEPVKSRCKELIRNLLTPQLASNQLAFAAGLLAGDGLDPNTELFPEDTGTDGTPTSEQFDVALVYAERAIALNPDGPLAVVTYGGVLCECGRYEEAIEYLERGHELMKGFEKRNSPIWLGLLSRAYFGDGQYSRARETLGQARSEPWASHRDAAKQIRLAQQLLDSLPEDADEASDSRSSVSNERSPAVCR